MQTRQKIIGADLAHIIGGSYGTTFVIPLGITEDRPELDNLIEGETVLLDEGDASAEGTVYSEQHDERQYWFARVDGTTWHDYTP